MTKKLILVGSIFLLFVTTAAQAATVVHEDFQIVQGFGVQTASFDISLEDLEYSDKFVATLADLGSDSGPFAPFSQIVLAVSDSEDNALGSVFGNDDVFNSFIFDTGGNVGEYFATVGFLSGGFGQEQGAFAVQIAALPIPTPIALLASALVALGIFGRRRTSTWETIKTA